VGAGAQSITVLMSVPSVTVRLSVNRAEQAMAGHVAEFAVLDPWCRSAFVNKISHLRVAGSVIWARVKVTSCGVVCEDGAA
jgi:hypothetical protein